MIRELRAFLAGLIVGAMIRELRAVLAAYSLAEGRPAPMGGDTDGQSGAAG